MLTTPLFLFLILFPPLSIAIFLRPSTAPQVRNILDSRGGWTTADEILHSKRTPGGMERCSLAKKSERPRCQAVC